MIGREYIKTLEVYMYNVHRWTILQVLFCMDVLKTALCYFKLLPKLFFNQIMYNQANSSASPDIRGDVCGGLSIYYCLLSKQLI